MVGLFGSKKKKRETALQPDEWPEEVESLGSSSFDEFITTYPLAVVDFWAPWCGPCKTMLPRLRKLERMYHGKVAFGKLDTQKYPDIAKKYKIMGIPHLMIFSYGKKVGNLIGLKSVGTIKSTLETLLKKI